MDHPKKLEEDVPEAPMEDQSSSRDSQETIEEQWQRPVPDVAQAVLDEELLGEVAPDRAGGDDVDQTPSCSVGDRSLSVDSDGPGPDQTGGDEPPGQTTGVIAQPPSKKSRPKPYKYGAVRENPDGSGNWQWAQDKHGPWQGATLFSESVRADFIRQQLKLGPYAIKGARPNGDGGHTDATSVHRDQQQWGPRRDQRPDILMQYEKTEKSKKEKQEQGHPEPLLWRGLVVIAPDKLPNRCVRGFPEMPYTLSSKEPGFALEAMSRLNKSIRMQDFRDRMQGHSRPSANSLSMRRTRYRESSGSLAWMPREGGKELKDYLDTLIPKELRDANTTRGFRDLNKVEVEKMKEANAGRFPGRKGKGKRDASAEAGPSTTKKPKKEQTPVAPSAPQSPKQSMRARPQLDPTLKAQDEPKGKGRAANTDAQALTSPEGEQEELEDFRGLPPVNQEEQRIVYHALMPTRAQITSITDLPTPMTDEHASYNDQWDALHEHMELEWVNRTKFRPDSMPEFLVKEKPWLGKYPQLFLHYQGPFGLIAPPE